MRKIYTNISFSDFSSVLREFIQECSVHTTSPLSSIILAVAGPVSLNCVTLTNRSQWVINGNSLTTEFNVQTPVKLINDFVAAGYGLLTLDHQNPNDCVIIKQGERNLEAPIACVGAGTGLGQCFLTPSETPTLTQVNESELGTLASCSSFTCYPSEGGHTEFAPRNALEFELLQFLMKKFEQNHRVSVERVISGTGIANIYEFLMIKFPEKTNQEIKKKVKIRIFLLFLYMIYTYFIIFYLILILFYSI